MLRFGKSGELVGFDYSRGFVERPPKEGEVRSGRHKLADCTFSLVRMHKNGRKNEDSLAAYALEVRKQEKEKETGNSVAFIRQVERTKLDLMAPSDEGVEVFDLTDRRLKSILTDEKAVGNLITLLKMAGLTLPQIGLVLRNAGFGNEEREENED